MYLAFHGWLSHERSQDLLPVSHIKRDTDDAALLTIIIPIVFGSVFIPLFIMMYRSWKWERENILKTQQALAREEGNGGSLDKAELPSDSSVIRTEMDSQRETLELPERKEGLCHEMPGSTAAPQELPGDLHEMPAEDCKNKTRGAKQGAQ
ncbi:hypothetical protein F5Y09DRAFT_317249 [Xylaria sp. FL1042]|nr:hypothetical protein F5Y09DRAFT_317249 [Xylaria sp. FL1042]